MAGRPRKKKLARGHNGRFPQRFAERAPEPDEMADEASAIASVVGRKASDRAHEGGHASEERQCGSAQGAQPKGNEPPAQPDEGGVGKVGEIDGGTMISGVAGGAEADDLAGRVGEDEMAKKDVRAVGENTSESEGMVFGYISDSGDSTSSKGSDIERSDDKDEEVVPPLSGSGKGALPEGALVVGSSEAPAEPTKGALL